MDVLPWFWNFVETDDDANIVGLSKNAPEEAIEAFKKWKNEQERLRAQGIKV